MKLIYRGVSYEYDPTQSRPGNTGRPARSTHQAHPYTLTYRGVKMQVDPNQAAQVSTLPSESDLIYRGVSYRVHRNAQGQVTALTQAPAKLRTPVIPSTLPREAVDRVHQDNLLNNLHRRLQSAKARGDQHLVSLLEAERKQLSA
jgi:Domain of unknown function (DUF4278)